jgi:FkbM family methyltransferase
MKFLKFIKHIIPLSLYIKLRNVYKIYFEKDTFTIQYAKWMIEKGDDTYRLNYPELDADSIILDLGGYVGDFAYSINKKYNCNVVIFEPHPRYYQACVERFKANKKIRIFNYGVGDQDGEFKLYDCVEGSSFLNPAIQSKQHVLCQIRNILHVLIDLKLDQVDLMKVNIEGGEYDLLQYLIREDKLQIAKKYQIQFHGFIENASSKRDFIVSALHKKFERKWCFEFVWEGWEQKIIDEEHKISEESFEESNCR